MQLVQLALVLGKCATCTKIWRRNAEKLHFFSGGPVRFSRPGCLPPLRLWWHTKSMISLINEICHLCQRAWPHGIDSHWGSLLSLRSINFHQVSRLQTHQLVWFLECCPCLGWHLDSCTLAYHGGQFSWQEIQAKEIGMWTMWRSNWCVVRVVVTVYHLQLFLL